MRAWQCNAACHVSCSHAFGWTAVQAEEPSQAPRGEIELGAENPGVWELVNIGNGYFQIRIHSPDGKKMRCLITFKGSDEVKLRDCEGNLAGPAMLNNWNFNQLKAGGYEVVNRWADFYDYPACLAAPSDTVMLKPCPFSVGRVRSLEGVSKRYAEPDAR
ncbi:hypothetical protein N5D61_09355 [Pseudomonas sp. GD03842]|uniref:hypothetical protein n=1 Tax=Pseudomonas sp. GD03842 TaxID=2975385 RepID=UPI002448BB08|nr:hypothetical protein [Pseudomonas sp. GD03842]MDH0746551.1 hypothetical protein [Pseudomonas sp. GD03842]